MKNPYLLPEKSVVSFSGGRTSGLMLRRILDAHHEARQPPPVVIFNNTGKEREETLKFVEDCAAHWGVWIHWLEYRYEAPVPCPTRDPDWYRLNTDERTRRWVAWQELMAPHREAGTKATHTFAEVSFAVACRDGEPFQEVIAARGFLPNPTMRFCTAELKIRTTNRFVRNRLGWEAYHNAIGLRADEPERVAKLSRKRAVKAENTLFGEERTVTRGAEHPPGETPLTPLAEAGVMLDDVMAFWASQPFNLRLRPDEGNCDNCFLKGANKLLTLISERPGSADWWAEMETRIKHRDQPGTARFRADRPPYKELKVLATSGFHWPADTTEPGCADGLAECRCTD